MQAILERKRNSFCQIVKLNERLGCAGKINSNFSQFIISLDFLVLFGQAKSTEKLIWNNNLQKERKCLLHVDGQSHSGIFRAA